MNWERRRAAMRQSAFGRLALGAGALVYGGVIGGRRLLYDAGLLKKRKLDAKVICIGNLTAGGAGKTPAVMLAAHTLRQRNHNVAIVSRGYGRTPKGEDVMVLLDDTPPAWSECGDEPWMMRNVLAGEGIPILVSPNKILAGLKAVTYYHAKVLVLDDGYQHLKLKRDLDILMVNAMDPFGDGRLLPLGNLREPLSALKRAHMVVLTHTDLAAPEQIQEAKDRIRAVNPAIAILESAHKPKFLLDIRNQKKHPLEELEGRDIVTLAGLADPVPFEEQLARLGAKLSQRWRYPDHHPYTLVELQAIENARRGLAGNAALLTTSKDFPRLPPGWQDVLRGDVYVLSITLEIVKGKNLWVDTLCQGL